MEELNSELTRVREENLHLLRKQAVSSSTHGVICSISILLYQCTDVVRTAVFMIKFGLD